jgi:hypothetical protein
MVRLDDRVGVMAWRASMTGVLSLRGAQRAFDQTQGRLRNRETLA